MVLLHNRPSLQYVQDISVHHTLVGSGHQDLTDDQSVIPADMTLDDPALQMPEALLDPRARERAEKS